MFQCTYQASQIYPQYGSHVNLEIWDARRSKKDRLVKEKWSVVTQEEISENHDYDLIFMIVNPEQGEYPKVCVNLQTDVK